MLLDDSPTVVWSHGFSGAVDVRWCSEAFWSADRNSNRSALLRSTFRRPPVPILSPSCRFLARCLKGFRLRRRPWLCSCPQAYVPFTWCYHSTRLHGRSNSLSTRWFLTLNGNTAWRNPSASIHFTNEFPKKYVSLISLRFISGKQIMSLIQYTVLGVMAEGGKWKRSLHYYISLLEFKFTRENLWLTNFEIHNFFCTPMEYVKGFAILSWISALIWTINVSWRDK